MGAAKFLRLILDVINTHSSPSARYKLSGGFYADIQWCCDFLRVFNGRQLFLSPQKAEMTADACPRQLGPSLKVTGCIITLVVTPPTLSALHINHKEMIAACLAAEHWSSQWANKQVVVHSDNQAAVGMINKGSTWNSIVMEALHRLVWLSATFNFRLVAQYIPGSSNGVADAFSQLHSPSHLL